MSYALGTRVLLYKSEEGFVCSPQNNHSKGIWVYSTAKQYASCYAPHNVSLPPSKTNKVVQELTTEVTTLNSLLKKAELREQYYLKLIHKFRYEITDMGLCQYSEAYTDSLLFLCSNPEAAVDEFLESEHESSLPK